MADLLLSEAELTYIVHGVQDNLREDGRTCDDYRHVELETGVLSNAQGSCKLTLGTTDVLVGIKADLDEPAKDTHNEGRLEFFVDFSANAAPAFEGRGGEELALQLTSALSNAYKYNGCMDLRALCLIPRTSCWVLHVDILLLQCGGNLLDAVSIAVKAALFNTKLPKVTVTRNEQGTNELEISDDPFDSQTLEIDHTPLIVTLNKVGQSHIVDASMSEEACTLAKLYVAATKDGSVTYVRKAGAGSLDPESVQEMLETGRKVGQLLNIALLDTLKHEQTAGIKPIGFLK